MTCASSLPFLGQKSQILKICPRTDICLRFAPDTFILQYHHGFGLQLFSIYNVLLLKLQAFSPFVPVFIHDIRICGTIYKQVKTSFWFE